MPILELLESRIAPATFIVTNLADSGEGSLREAILDANARPGADVIMFASGLTGTIEVLNEQMVITDTLTIKGPGANKLALDANFQSRFFLVNDGNALKDSPFSVSGLSFIQGEERAALGAGQRGGAIASVESLNVKGCVFAGNEAAEAAGGAIAILQIPDGVPVNLDVRNSAFRSNSSGAFGAGAIFANVEGSITLRNAVFTDNSAETSGGAATLRAGAGKTLLIQNCEFLGNRASEAGALFIANGEDTTVILRKNLFADNQASLRDGGGAVIRGGTVLIDRSVFTQNIAQDQGGGLEIEASSSVTIRSSQFLENVALAPESGGGGLRVSLPAGGDARIIASIISGNIATQGGGILVAEDPTSHHSADVSIVRSSIIGNVAEGGDGGGVLMLGDGEFKMLFSQVVRNSAAGAGGGLALLTSTPAVIIGSIIGQNRAAQGGGVFADPALELFSSRILGNFALEGGAIRTFGDLSLVFSLVSGNSATIGGGIVHARDTDLSLHGSRVVGNISPDGQQIVEV